MNLISDSKASILLVILLTLITLSLLGASLIGMILNESRSLRYNVDRIKALYLAEAGVSLAVWELKSGRECQHDTSAKAAGRPYGRGYGNVGHQDNPVQFNGGFFYTVHCSQLGIIESIGIFNDTERRIQIRYVENQ